MGDYGSRKALVFAAAGQIAALTCLVLAVIVIRGHRPVGEDPKINRLCEDNLNTIWIAMRAYTEDSWQSRFPAMPRIPGRLMFDPESMYPSFLSDPAVLVSLAHPNWADLRRDRTDIAKLVDDHSYFYLGYMVMNGGSLESFTEDYKRWITSGEPIPESYDEILPEYAEDVARRREIRRNELDAVADRIRASGGDPRRAKLYYEVPLGDHERNIRLVLRDGIERFLRYGIGDPSPATRERARIPIIVERPELHGGGGHVLFLDGHVEFIQYPGKFPMMETFIEGLLGLDKLGDS